jgi:hypothetical protein
MGAMRKEPEYQAPGSSRSKDPDGGTVGDDVKSWHSDLPGLGREDRAYSEMPAPRQVRRRPKIDWPDLCGGFATIAAVEGNEKKSPHWRAQIDFGAAWLGAPGTARPFNRLYHQEIVVG